MSLPERLRVAGGATALEAADEIERLRSALGGMVDLYRHPDGCVIVEPGSSEADDALIVAMDALAPRDEQQP